MAKRTLEQSRTFFKRETESRGDGRELYLTPIPIIEKIVQSLIERKPDLTEKVWIDPCAGDGRWESVVSKHGIRCESYDIHPLTESVVANDFFSKNRHIQGDNLFFIGNPPFSLVKEFVQRSLLLADNCYYLGGSQVITGDLSKNIDLLHIFENYEGKQTDRRSKLFFIDSNDKEVPVWCCGALFGRILQRKFERTPIQTENSFRVGISTYCSIDERVVSIEK